MHPPGEPNIVWRSAAHPLKLHERNSVQTLYNIPHCRAYSLPYQTISNNPQEQKRPHCPQHRDQTATPRDRIVVRVQKGHHTPAGPSLKGTATDAPLKEASARDPITAAFTPPVNDKFRHG
jgi:hypothetical protein